LRFIRAESINRGEQRIGVNSDDMFDGSRATAFICNAENFARSPPQRRAARLERARLPKHYPGVH
jgi:hypothetical protein